jgi:hypothetical protein
MSEHDVLEHLSGVKRRVTLNNEMKECKHTGTCIPEHLLGVKRRVTLSDEMKEYKHAGKWRTGASVRSQAWSHTQRRNERV